MATPTDFSQVVTPVSKTNWESGMTILMLLFAGILEGAWKTSV
jgi:hypothetical protein